MKADLHVHSHYSDGSSSVEEVMEMASKRGITHLSLVDHDTVAGLEAAQIEGTKHGITIVPGIEISAYDFTRNRKVHILGYWFDKEATHIQELCRPLLKGRHENSLWQIEQLQKHEYAIQLEEVAKKAKMSGVIYKQHIMHGLLDHHFTTPLYQELYRTLFKGGGICARDIEYVDAVDAVKAIKADNGFAVLAHPGQLDSYAIIPELVRHGLDGIEREHMDHTKEDRQKVDQYADEYGLFRTGGSDFHGDYGTQIRIGDLISPTELIESVLSK